MRDFWTAKSEELAVNVFAYEYSGYGLATGGRPSEKRICADATAALAYATENLGLQPACDVVLYGKSIGSVPALHLACNHAVRGVILVSGLVSGARTLSPKFGAIADGLETVAFNNIARLKRVRDTPMQLIHGTLDEVVSIKDAKFMHTTCKAHHPLEPCWIDGGKHNDIMAEAEFLDKHSRAVQRFLQHLLGNDAM